MPKCNRWWPDGVHHTNTHLYKLAWSSQDGNVSLCAYSHLKIATLELLDGLWILRSGFVNLRFLFYTFLLTAGSDKLVTNRLAKPASLQLINADETNKRIDRRRETEKWTWKEKEIRTRDKYKSCRLYQASGGSGSSHRPGSRTSRNIFLTASTPKLWPPSSLSPRYT